MLLRSAGEADGRVVGTRTEAHVVGLGARPDVGVTVGQLLNGHVELKAPGRGARGERFSGADHIQWQKFQKLPNLVYTDGSEWTLYRTGEPVRRVRIGRRIHETGARGIEAAAAVELGLLLQDFLGWNPIVPATPRALANVLAPLCHLVRQDVLAAMAVAGSPLDLLAQEWRRYLFPDADDLQFADAYAQTVTYALLLARFSGATEIGIEAAARTLSRGHTLLAQALRILTDQQARAEIGTGIDLDAASASPTATRYAFRALDRQWVLADGRLGDFMRPALWEASVTNRSS